MIIMGFNPFSSLFFISSYMCLVKAKQLMSEFTPSNSNLCFLVYFQVHCLLQSQWMTFSHYVPFKITCGMYANQSIFYYSFNYTVNWIGMWCKRNPLATVTACYIPWVLHAIKIFTTKEFNLQVNKYSCFQHFAWIRKLYVYISVYI